MHFLGIRVLGKPAGSQLDGQLMGGPPVRYRHPRKFPCVGIADVVNVNALLITAIKPKFPATPNARASSTMGSSSSKQAGGQQPLIWKGCVYSPPQSLPPTNGPGSFRLVLPSANARI